MLFLNPESADINENKQSDYLSINVYSDLICDSSFLLSPDEIIISGSISSIKDDVLIQINQECIKMKMHLIPKLTHL